MNNGLSICLSEFFLLHNFNNSKIIRTLLVQNCTLKQKKNNPVCQYFLQNQIRWQTCMGQRRDVTTFVSVLCTEYYKNYIVTTTPSNTIALDSSKFDTWSNRWLLCNYEYMNISAQWSHLNRVAPIPFFITDLIPVCKFWVSADTDPIPVLFFFLFLIMV